MQHIHAPLQGTPQPPRPVCCTCGGAVQGWTPLLVRLALANLVMGALLWWMVGGLEAWLEAAAPERVWRLVQCIVAGGAAYFAVLALSGLRPAHLRNTGGAAD